MGFGYGPGVGKGTKIILILSRASGAPVAANAIEYAAALAGEGCRRRSTEMAAAKKAGLEALLCGYKKGAAKVQPRRAAAPPKSGYRVHLRNRYNGPGQRSGGAVAGRDIRRDRHGCIGPVVMVAEDDLEGVPKPSLKRGLYQKGNRVLTNKLMNRELDLRQISNAS